jgi:hypothetical protein
MNHGKAVEEVWTWREALAKELENVPEAERVKYINEKAREGCRKLGINCPAGKKTHTPA